LSFNVLYLTGEGSDLNVFSVDHSELEQASLVSVQMPPGAFALLNINGGAVSHASFGVGMTGVNEHSVLFNFYEATSVDVSGTRLPGSLLAPQADVFISMLAVAGNVVGKTVSLSDGSTEGKRLAGEPWENTPWVVIMADEDGDDEPGYTLTFEPMDDQQDVNIRLSDAGDLEIVAEGFPTCRYQLDRISRLVVLDRQGLNSLKVSDEIEFPIEFAMVEPVAYDDSASLEGANSVQVRVLSNDLAGPAPLDLSSVEIVTQPKYGTVKVDAATGVVSYQQVLAQPGGVMSDVFWYTVRDGLSNVSTARRVRVTL
jgi:hypothetical protein